LFYNLLWIDYHHTSPHNQQFLQVLEYLSTTAPQYREPQLFYASLGRKSKENGNVLIEDDEINDYVAEGVEAMVPYKGSVTDILKQLTGGVRSGLSYCGAHTLKQMQENSEFIKISGAGFAESQPHDVSLM